MLDNIFFLLLSSFLGTFFISKLMLKYVSYKRFLDIPDDRKIHKKIVPRFGGVPFSIVTLLVFSIYVDFNMQFNWFFLAALAIILVGFFDDIFRLSWKVKLFVQLIVGGSLFYKIAALSPSVSFFGFDLNLSIYLLGLLWMLWFIGMVNSVNLIDGMDGLAGGSFVFVTFGAIYLGWFFDNAAFLMFNVIFLGTLLAFLFFNGKPAKFFMGDAGSLFLGFILAAFPLLFHINDMKDFMVIDMTPFIIMASFFIIDTIRVFLLRILDKKNPLLPDNRHLHHNLLDQIASYNTTIFVIFIFVLLSAITTAVYIQFNLKLWGLIFYLTFVVVLIVFPFFINSLILFLKFMVSYIRKFIQNFKSQSVYIPRKILVFLFFMYYMLLIMDLLFSNVNNFLLNCLYILYPLILIAFLKLDLLSRKIVFILFVSFQSYLILLISNDNALSSLLTVKIGLMCILFIGFMLYFINNTRQFLLRFWLVYDLIFFLVLFYIFMLKIMSVSLPLFFPSNLIIFELLLNFLVIRILLYFRFSKLKN